MHIDTKPTGITRETIMRAFYNIMGNSYNMKYTEDHFSNRTSPSEYKLPPSNIRSNKYIPGTSVVVVAHFDYYRDLYKFQVSIDMIFSNKPTKQIQNKRNYKSLQYSVLKWFGTNGNQYIIGHPEIIAVDIYEKIINDIKFLTNGS